MINLCRSAEQYCSAMFVKICGITNEEDALMAVAMGADALGFVFAPSPRQVVARRVYDITRQLPREIMTVGVFRNDTPERVIELVHTSGLKAAQLHGHETPEVTQHVRSAVTYVIKAFAAGSDALASANDHRADFLLIDAPMPGSGSVFDWNLIDSVPKGAPPILLAGGLHADNVADAIRRVRPFGVDVSSGVEASPGHKDARKVRAFILAARDADVADDTDDDDSAGEMYDWQDE
jgi:phosphoribosylanthranilate isomerase